MAKTKCFIFFIQTLFVLLFKIVAMKKLFFFLTIFISFLSIAQQSGVIVNNKGASATTSKGGGVLVKKKEVSAKSNTGNGVGANNKGLEVKGNKGGMSIKKKSFQK